MDENQETQVEPQEARGRTLKEKAKEIDPRIAVTSRPADAEKLLAGGASAVLIENNEKLVDCAPLLAYIAPLAKRKTNTHPDTQFVERENVAPLIFGLAVDPVPGNEATEEKRIFDKIEDDIAAYPPDIQKILRAILVDARALRALLPHKRLKSIYLHAQRGGENGSNAQDFHKDGDGTTRIIRAYTGLPTEFSNADKTQKVTPPPGTVSIFTGSPECAMHRQPAIPAKTFRIRLQLELD